jgi:hypothetical protein
MIIYIKYNILLFYTMSFQKTVLIIAAIVLSFMLFFVGLAMQGLKKAQQYPPEIAACPDYWSMQTDGTCVHNGEINVGTPQPNCAQYDETHDETHDKKEWALECEVQWDGVSNI